MQRKDAKLWVGVGHCTELSIVATALFDELLAVLFFVAVNAVDLFNEVVRKAAIRVPTATLSRTNEFNVPDFVLLTPLFRGKMIVKALLGFVLLILCTLMDFEL